MGVWLLLAAAICSEVTATLSLRASQGFTKLLPSGAAVAGYATAAFFLAQTLQRGVTVGVAYSIWCAVGVALVAIAGAVLFDEKLSVLQTLGIAAIIIGVVAIEAG